VSLVVLLRGLNVGGHRRFRPSTLAQQLKHLDAVNIGATGTFVIRAPVSPSQVRLEIERRLSFDADIMICQAREIVALLSHDAFARVPARPGVVRFVSILSRVPRSTPQLPMTFPPRGRWLVKVLAREGRYVFGMYRRDMKVIGYLGKLDGIFGVSATTRNWNTITMIARVIERTP
jgi:uncharacterized protein (DUF1697 family)